MDCDEEVHLCWPLKLCTWHLKLRRYLGLFPFIQRASKRHQKSVKWFICSVLSYILLWIVVARVVKEHYLAETQPYQYPLMPKMYFRLHNIMSIVLCISILLIYEIAVINSNKVVQVFDTALFVSSNICDQSLCWKPYKDCFYILITLVRLAVIALLRPSTIHLGSEKFHNEHFKALSEFEHIFLPYWLGVQVIQYSDLLYCFTMVQMAALRSINKRLRSISWNKDKIKNAFEKEETGYVYPPSHSIEKLISWKREIEAKHDVKKDVKKLESHEKLQQEIKNINPLMKYQNEITECFSLAVVVIVFVCIVCAITISFLTTSRLVWERPLILTASLFSLWATVVLLQLYCAPDCVYQQVSLYLQYYSKKVFLV